MPVVEIEIYEALKEKIGEDSAKTLLEFIDLRVEKEFERKKDVLATKEDIAELKSATKQDIAELKSATKEDIAELKSVTKQDIAELEVKIEKIKAELEVKIEKIKTELVRWMFMFWVGQIGALIAILALFFKALK